MKKLLTVLGLAALTASGAVYYPSTTGPAGATTINNLTLTRQDNFRGPTGQAIPDVLYDADPNEDWGKLFSLKMLINLHQRHEINLLAVTLQATNWFAPASWETILRYHGLDTVPVAQGDPEVLRNPADSWGQFVATNFFNIGSSNRVYVNAKTLMRQVLASRPDKSLTIFCEGQMENLWDTFFSPADSISPLTGQQLLEQKTKEIILICGVYPGPGFEGNLFYEPVKAQVVNYLTNCNVTFTSGTGGNWLSNGIPVLGGTGAVYGWSDGVFICSNIWSYLSYDDPTRAAVLNYQSLYNIAAPPYEPAWAQLGILYMARGLTSLGTNWFDSQQGSNWVTSTGSNWWSNGGPLSWKYLKPSWQLANGLTTNGYIATINGLITQTNFPGRPFTVSFNPTSISNLAMWLEMDSEYALADNQVMQIWHDAAPVANQINPSGAANASPTNRLNQINGRAASQWGGQVATFSTTSIDSSKKPFSVIGVVYITNAVNNNTILGGGAGNMALRAFQGKWEILQDSAASVCTSAPGTAPNNQWIMFAVTCDANGNYSFYTNGVKCGTAVNAATFGSSAGTYIGRDVSAGAGSFGGMMATLIKYNAALNQTDLQNVFTWLAQKSKYAIDLPVNRFDQTYQITAVGGLIQGDQNNTNALSVSTGGLVNSNAVSSVQFFGGQMVTSTNYNSGLGQATFTVDFSRPVTVIVTNASFTISGCANLIPGMVNKTTLFFTNSAGANINVTTTGWRVLKPQGLNQTGTLTITNGANLAQADCWVYPGFATNILFFPAQ